MRGIAVFIALLLSLGGTAVAGQEQALMSNSMILGCWSDADKGDSAELKLHFVSNGALVQYDENQEEKRKRTFGAWEMQSKSTYLKVYWPSGGTSAYTVKRIGPILHFSGLNGVANFTLRQIEGKECWEPKG